VAVVSMSKQEFSRLEVLLRVQCGRLRIADACELIGLRRRQVFRLLRGLKQDGAASLVSKHRGKPSNHRLPIEVRALALSIVRERYADFGPTLAAEKLAAHHGCTTRLRLSHNRGPPQECTLALSGEPTRSGLATGLNEGAPRWRGYRHPSGRAGS
jgi:Winged helix-turn helix